jgi:hypothetical protein
MIYSTWKTATIDIDRATEFTGDDVDRFSSLVDLEKPYESLILSVPAIDSAALSVYVQQDDSIATTPFIVHLYKPEAAGNAVMATTAGTGSITIVLPIGGVQFVRIYSGANQSADRAIKVRGVRS